MLPIQKAEIVKLIRKNLNKICLAIGDGGNDVSMIKEGNIGIGIYGEEGMNAVQASDYAIPEFRMIWRLLFVHGRWNYIRISEMILYFTYKSILFTIPRIVFSFICHFSGQPIYDDVYIALYNIVFTSVPLIIRALFDQDINYVYKREAVDLERDNLKNEKGGSVERIQ
jgi:magnesium-transporting ATPase (P-type)